MTMKKNRLRTRQDLHIEATGCEWLKTGYAPKAAQPARHDS